MEKSNIKQEYNNATTGLNLDQSLNQVPKGKLTYALNAVVENHDESSVNYQNELGNEFCVDFPDGFLLIGKHYINEKNKVIFFITNPSTGGSQIGYMKDNDCEYRVLVNAPCLNFSILHPIHKVVHRISNCSTEIYWTDGYNPRRYLDIDDIPKVIRTGSPLCNPVYTDDLDCNQLKVQPNFSIPLLKVDKVLSGGELIAGTYQFAIQYSDPSGNPFTSYFSITNPTPIGDPSITTMNFNYPVGKSIIVEVSNIDVTGQFEYFNLAVIKTINGISSPELVGTYFIDNSIKQITYTGQIVDNIKLSIDDIFEKFPYYDIAKDLTTVQDILVWDGLSSINRVNYQKIANNITLQWETWRMPDDYSNEVNATNIRGYLRDEVYSFELVFLLRNGKQTDRFHIPGKIKGYIENGNPDVPDTDDDFIGTPEYESGGVGYSPYWRIYNTATLTGTSPEYIPNDPSYKGPYQYGEFGYHESTEEYPCNEDVWGELAGQKIRHHRMPDVNVSPIFESNLFTNEDNMVMGNTAVYPLGVKVDTNQIRALINSSDLTQEEKDDIVGYKIVRGDRGVNKSIIAKGILRNVGKYNRQGQEYYFPNYPYNDLNVDPFIQPINNANTELCEEFLVIVLKLTSEDENGVPCMIVEYNNCETGKLSEEVYYDINLDGYELCSIGRPRIMSPGVTNQMIQTPTGPIPLLNPFTGQLITIGYITYANYDVWRIRRDNNPGRGLRACWDDPIMGPNTSQWIAGTLGPGGSDFRIRVRTGTEPFKCAVNGRRGKLRKTFRESIIAEFCDVPEDAYETFFDDNYRYVFNSPETSFGKPFLGTILKLESVIFGGGKAHFTEVKKNAKYKLLTEEAQRDALNSAEALGAISVGFNAGAMFTAYQTYLTIYINGITRKNYAYSFNSVADYNYSDKIPNEQGVKQRNLDICRYLLSGVQNVGDEYNVNNYQRESSVYIKTQKPIPFADSSPEMLSSGTPKITDYSRFTISDEGNCSTPGYDVDIKVVSYYGSIKNEFLNQWGQIYSYDSVDTGFQKMFGTDTPDTVFGGDTFINRFSFKTKLPFFIDNRVGAPDDSDIFYDEIGNVAYPVFWHSARSILRNYVGDDTGILSNIISYKAHNFDCPNSQLPGPESEPSQSADSNPNRTFYDGYFYMFAYGIPNFYCESSFNVDLRQAFNIREGDFWPHVSAGIPDEWLQESFVPIAQDNTYYYNTTFSKQNRENLFTFLPPDWENKLCFTHYPFRAIYSDPQNTDADNRVNNWLIYRATSYFDFPQNYGKLTSLDGIQNSAILARFENKSLLYNSLLTIDTNNPQAAYIGNPQLFRGAPPIDFAETDIGYVGSQHKLLLKIPQGQVSIDAKRGNVMLLVGNQSVDLAAFGSGMNRFFTTHLPFKILKHFPNVDIDNHFTGIGLHGVYDSNFNRIIITKLDYVPLDTNIKYDEDNHNFYIETVLSDSVVKTPVSLTDEDFFCNKSFTISFNFNTKSWISFHSYLPNWYIGENDFFYSGINGCCSDFDFIAGEIIPTVKTTTTTTTYPRIITTTSTTTIAPTTTTTTTIAYDCDLEGTGVVIDNYKEKCQLQNYLLLNFVTGYVLDDTPIDTTGSESDACELLQDLAEDPEYVLTSIAVYVNYLEVDEFVLIKDDYDQCLNAPDGWYFLEQDIDTPRTIHVVNGVIIAINDCPQITTTTTTTEEPTTTTL
jgi:hypothetical protein